jgi:hypothetical protein
MIVKRFVISFAIGLLIFLLVNILAADLASDCGLLAVFGRDPCADDIARLGWPMQFYEAGGFAYRSNFSPLLLILDVVIGIVISSIPAWIYSLSNRPLPK